MLVGAAPRRTETLDMLRCDRALGVVWLHVTPVADSVGIPTHFSPLDNSDVAC